MRTTPRLNGKRVAILVERMYEDLELWYPRLRLQEEGAEVLLVGPESQKQYKSKHGYPARSERSVSDLRATDFDAVVIPGGFAPDFMRRVPEMVEFVRQAALNPKTVVGAICHAGWLLASAKVIQGRVVTSFHSIRDDLRHAGAEWVDRPVVRDGNLVTSRGPDDLPEFARAMVDAIAES